jgi:hypothetical protein
MTVVLCLSLAVQRRSYRDLWGSKDLYERIVRFVERETPTDAVILTDLWWFDAVTADLYPGRRVLVAADSLYADRAFEQLEVLPRVFVVYSDTESPDNSVLKTHSPRRLVTVKRVSGPERGLVLMEFGRGS